MRKDMRFKKDLTALSLAARFNGTKSRGVCQGIVYALLYDIINREEKNPNTNAWKEPGSFIDIFMLITAARENTSASEMQEYITSAMHIAKGSNAPKHVKKIVNFLNKYRVFNELRDKKNPREFYNDIMAYIDQVTFFQDEYIDLTDEAGLKRNVLGGYCEPKQKALVLGKDLKRYQVKHIVTAKEKAWDAITEAIRQVNKQDNKQNEVTVFSLHSHTHASVFIYKKGSDHFFLIDNDTYEKFFLNMPSRSQLKIYTRCNNDDIKEEFKRWMNHHSRDTFLITQYQTACPRSENTPIETLIQIPPNRKDDFLREILFLATRCLNEEVLKELPKVKISKNDIHPITMAIMTNDSNIINIAKKRYDDDDDAKHHRQNWLIEACRQGKIDYVETLVEHDVDVNCIEDGSDPLSAAVNNKHKDIMWYLLGKGANINAISDNANRSIARVPSLTSKKSLFNSEGIRGAFGSKGKKQGPSKP